MNDKSKIDRDVYQGGLEVALLRTGFCLDQIEKLRLGGRQWSTRFGPRLTFEEVVGALVAAEQAMREEAEALHARAEDEG